MANVNNHIQRSLENYIKRRYANFTDEYVDRVNELLEELRGLLTKRKVVDYIDRINKVNAESKDELIDEVIDLNDFIVRLERIYKELEDGDGIIPKLNAYIAHLENGIDEESFSHEELVTAAKLAGDLKQVLAGQEIITKVYNLKDLDQRVEQISKRMDWEELRHESRTRISELRKTVEKDIQDYYTELKKIKEQFDKTLSVTANWLVDEISRNNFPINDIFRDFVNTLKRVSNIDVEIEVITPDYEYDLYYTNFLNASENRDREQLLSIYLTVMKTVPYDLYDWDTERIIAALESYFN